MTHGSESDAPAAAAGPSAKSAAGGASFFDGDAVDAFVEAVAAKAGPARPAPVDARDDTRADAPDDEFDPGEWPSDVIPEPAPTTTGDALRSEGTPPKARATDPFDLLPEPAPQSPPPPAPGPGRAAAPASKPAAPLPRAPKPELFDGVVLVPHPLHAKAKKEKKGTRAASSAGAVDGAGEDFTSDNLTGDDFSDEDGADPDAATGGEEFAPLPPTKGSGWTIPLLCLGLALIACCLLIPLADENRRLVWERERLRLDLEQIQNQVAVNDEFLKRIGDDPTLAERLAQRQMKTIRQGTRVLDLTVAGGKEEAAEETSPFLLVSVPPPAQIPEFRPVGGLLSTYCRDPRRRLYTMGAGLLLVAAGLILGFTPAEEGEKRARAFENEGE